MKKCLLQIAILSTMAVSGIAAAVGPPEAKVPDAIVANLKLFVGHWTYETTTSVNGKPGTIKGDQQCSPAGRIGVLCTMHEIWPDGPRDTVQLLGYDSGSQQIVITALTDHGIVETFPTTWHDNTFTIGVTGKDPSNGKTARIVEKGTFAADGNSMKQHITVHQEGATLADITTVYDRLK
jgi:hypothetical protein